MTSVITNAIASFQTTLQSSIASGDTSMTLVSATTDDGVVIPSGIYGFTIDQGLSSEEYVIGTVSGTSVTSMLRGISVIDGKTEIVASKKAHAKGALVKITDHPALITLCRILKGDLLLDPTDLIKYSSAPTYTYGQKQLVTWDKSKDYTDSVAVAGAPNMDTTTKGIAEEATTAEIDADTQTGGTGAELAINPFYLSTSKYATRLPSADEKAALAGTSGTPSASNKYVTNADTTGTGAIPRSGSLYSATFTAGEAIDTTAKPLAVYVGADGKVYKTNATDLAKIDVIGFAPTGQNIAPDGTITILMARGLNITGFTGLTINTNYFLADVGSSQADISQGGDTNNNSKTIGNNSPEERWCIKFTPTTKSKLITFTIRVRKNNTPSNNLVCELRTGTPTGTTNNGGGELIATSSVPASSIGSPTDVVFTFNKTLKATAYYFLLYHDVPEGGSNYFNIRSTTTDANAYGWQTSVNWTAPAPFPLMVIDFQNNTFVSGDITDYFYTYNKKVGRTYATTAIQFDTGTTIGDYISCSYSANYTAPTDGIISASAIQSGSVVLIGYINGIEVHRTSTNTPSTGCSLTFPVKKGDIWRVTGSGGTSMSLIFTPLN